jgi:hypothetical protein
MMRMEMIVVVVVISIHTIRIIGNNFNNKNSNRISNNTDGVLSRFE